MVVSLLCCLAQATTSFGAVSDQICRPLVDTVREEGPTHTPLVDALPWDISLGPTSKTLEQFPSLCDADVL